MPVEQVAKGSLSPSQTHRLITTEWGKAGGFLREKKELATTPINKLSLSKQEKIVFQSKVGSELNVDQKGNAALSGRAALIRQQIKQAGNALTKEEKYLYEAQAEAAEATGKFLELIVKGNYSYEQALGKKVGGFLFFGGYKVLDKFIRATLTIAEKGGKTSVALENIKAIEQFKEIPSVSAALAKNAEKITKLKSKAEDPRTAPFQEDAEVKPPYGEGASASQGLPPELASKLAGQQPGRN